MISRRGVSMLGVFGVLMLGTGTILADDTAVSNVVASQRFGTKLVDITYDVSGAATVSVTVAVSTNAGATYDAPAGSVSGDGVGPVVTAGAGKHIVWDCGTDWNRQFTELARVKITAEAVGGLPPLPDDMVLIPAGLFLMGDTFDEADTPDVPVQAETPVHQVTLSPFYVDRYEVTKALWDEVAAWAADHGYDIGPDDASGKATNHPVHSVSWYECAKWCNARSEKEGREPAYYTTAAFDTVYRTGNRDLYFQTVKWGAGYRLPTSAEWEKAARGGTPGRRFPWGDLITHLFANYSAVASYYDPSPYGSLTPHHNFDEGGSPYTSPVGIFEFGRSPYGLSDMAGNVAEWCWDRYNGGGYNPAPTMDPTGPSSGSSRIYRGGSWAYWGYQCRVSNYDVASPNTSGNVLGFRTVLPVGQ